MHYLMLVTLDLLDGETSLDARQRAHDLLCEDDSFCGPGGRFGAPLCDWFLIGGRWSGLLKETLLGQPYKAAFAQQFPDMATDFYPATLIDTHRGRLDQLWQAFGGTGPSPVTRDSREQLGYKDDAMVVDQALFDHFLAHYRDEPFRLERGDHCKFADLENESVDETFIGRKWLVVVDYHN